MIAKALIVFDEVNPAEGVFVRQHSQVRRGETKRFQDRTGQRASWNIKYRTKSSDACLGTGYSGEGRIGKAQVNQAHSTLQAGHAETHVQERTHRAVEQFDGKREPCGIPPIG